MAMELQFDNEGSEAAVFHVYDILRLDQIPRRYTVEAGKTLQDTWPVERVDAQNANTNQYDLWVLGPNGFHRSFIGVVRVGETSDADVSARYLPAQKALQLRFHNRRAEPVTFSIAANAYLNRGPWQQVVDPGETQSLQWTLSASDNWYDFTVRSNSDDRFQRRLAGRMEDGNPSTSDPAAA